MSLPAMPSPERTVSKSLSHLRRIGFTDFEGLSVIVAVVDSAAQIVRRESPFDPAWLDQVRQIAVTRAERLLPSAQVSAERTHEGVRHRDGD